MTNLLGTVPVFISRRAEDEHVLPPVKRFYLEDAIPRRWCLAKSTNRTNRMPGAGDTLESLAHRIAVHKVFRPRPGRRAHQLEYLAAKLPRNTPFTVHDICDATRWDTKTAANALARMMDSGYNVVKLGWRGANRLYVYRG